MKRILAAGTVILCAHGLWASDFYASDGITNIAYNINQITTYYAFSQPGRWQCDTVPDQDDIIVISKYDNTYAEGAYGKNNSRYNDITIRGAGTVMNFCGNRAHKFFGRITVEDGAVFKMTYGADNINEGRAYFKPSLVLRVLPDSQFLINRSVAEDPILNEKCLLVGGTLHFGDPSFYVYSLCATNKITVWFQGNCALKGTALTTDNVGAKDGTSVLNLEAGSLTLVGSDDAALWPANGGYLNFTPYSTCEVRITNTTIRVSDVYSTYFKGETPHMRYNGGLVSSSDFEKLFYLFDDPSDGCAHLKLKDQSSDVILVDGQAAATRTYDNQELKPLDYFRVKYPATGATVAYSLDDGETWLDAIPRVHDAGTYTVKVKVTADGFDDLVATYTHTVLPRNAASFSFTAPDVNYTGSPIVPTLTISDTEPFCGTLVSGTDYDTVCSDNVNPGTATCTVNYKGNYSGSRATTFKIIAPKRSGDIVVDPSAASGGDGTKEHPINSLTEACQLAASGACLKLVAGSYLLDTACAFEAVENVTVEGPADGLAIVRPNPGVSTRHFGLSAVTNVTFKNLQFRDAALELNTSDETTAQGGSFRIVNSTNVTFVGCSFVSNVVQNTLSSQTSLHEQGGAIYALETALTLKDCVFEANGAVAKYATRLAYGTAIYLYRANVSADNNILRMGLAATNCIFRSNYGYSADKFVTGAIYTSGWGLDFYNCLISGNYATSDCQMNLPVHCTGYGAFQRYTQCTIADNTSLNAFYLGTSWDMTSRQPKALLIRSIVAGHLDDFDANNVILIDSVYSSGTPPTASEKLFGTTYTSSNYARAPRANLICHEGQSAPGSVAAERDAGWRPANEKTYDDWFVAETGSDANAGTAAAPFRTLTKALNSAENGDTIHLGEGRYTRTGGEIFPYAFRERHGLTIVGAGRDATFIDGEGDTTDLTVFDISASSGLCFKDLSVTGTNPQTTQWEIPAVLKAVATGGVRFDGVGIVSNYYTHVKHQTVNGTTLDGILRIDRANFDFTDCILTGNVCRLCQSRHGSFSRSTSWLVTSRCAFIRFLNCLIAENGYDVSMFKPTDTEILYYNAFLMQGSYSYMRFLNCLIRDNGVRAGTVASINANTRQFYASSGSEVFRFENCTFDGNEDVTFLLANYATANFYNSIFMHEGTFCTATGKNVGALDTLFSRTTEEDASFDSYIKTKTDCIFGGDPEFRDAENGNYELIDGSPCIDTGLVRDWMNDNPAYCDGRDLSGQSRLVGYKKRRDRLPDMGCFERQRAFGFMVILK